jgi:hypothetical protein
MRVRVRVLLVLCGLLLLVAAWQVRTLSQSVSSVTNPEQQFGASIGDDYFLATYTSSKSTGASSIASPIE